MQNIETNNQKMIANTIALNSNYSKIKRSHAKFYCLIKSFELYE
jgi:hypothetical protein